MATGGDADFAPDDDEDDDLPADALEVAEVECVKIMSSLCCYVKKGKVMFKSNMSEFDLLRLDSETESIEGDDEDDEIVSEIVKIIPSLCCCVKVG